MNSEIKLSVSILIVLGIVLGILDCVYNIDFKDVVVEAHGLLLDVVVFGVLILIFNNIQEKRTSIKRYKEEIEDFRDWKEPEASYRIFGIVKRLQKLNVYDIDLNRTNIPELQIENLMFMLAVVKKPRTNKPMFTVRGNIPNWMLSRLKKEYKT